MTLCASFCWKSLSRPFLCNLDSTPPQVINAAANDGEPGVGGQSPTSQDFAPIQDGLPEISARFCNRPDFTSAKKARAAPNFYLGLGLLEWVQSLFVCWDPFGKNRTRKGSQQN